MEKSMINITFKNVSTNNDKIEGNIELDGCFGVEHINLAIKKLQKVKQDIIADEMGLPTMSELERMNNDQLFDVLNNLVDKLKEEEE